MFRKVGDESRGIVTIWNPNTTPALMLRLNLLRSGGQQILPVIYSDNYFHLMPGERRTINISYKLADGMGDEPHVDVTGFNLSGEQ